MIDLESMNDLLKLISRNLKKDICCYAFGGNAMMHYGYKNSTKDIDLLFEDQKALDEFITAIRMLGYEKKSLVTVYSKELIKEKNKPVMYTKGDERFDLFLKQVFQTKLNDKIKERTYGRFDFIKDEKTLSVLVMSKEDIILMKSITKREKDFDDILTIVKKEKNIDWNLIVEEAVWQAKHGDGWVILDLEETLQRLREHTLIKQDLFEKLYQADIQ